MHDLHSRKKASGYCELELTSRKRHHPRAVPGLAQIAVDDRLNRDIVTAPCKMVSSNQAELLRPHVLLERRKQVDVLLRHEWHKDADRAVQTGLQDDLTTTSDKGDDV